MSWQTWLHRGAMGIWVIVWVKMGFAPELVFASAPIIFTFFVWQDLVQPLRQSTKNRNPTPAEEHDTGAE